MSTPRPDSTATAVGHDSETAQQRAELAGKSVGQLLGEISQDLSTLMRQEVELAKAEIKAEISKAGKGAGMLGGAGFAGYMLMLFASIAAWWGLGHLLDLAWAALIVAAIWAVIGTALAVTGRATLRQVNPVPERTIDTAKEIPPTLKPNS